MQPEFPAAGTPEHFYNPNPNQWRPLHGCSLSSHQQVLLYTSITLTLIPYQSTTPTLIPTSSLQSTLDKQDIKHNKDSQHYHQPHKSSCKPPHSLPHNLTHTFKLNKISFKHSFTYYLFFKYNLYCQDRFYLISPFTLIIVILISNLKPISHPSLTPHYTNQFLYSHSHSHLIARFSTYS